MSRATVEFSLQGEASELRPLLAETWRSRDLISVLARKDFFVRYRRASFGVAWALALPLLQAAVLAVVLPKLVRFDVPGSYLVFVLAGTVAWSFFASSLVAGASSIIDGSDVSTRVYFPRLVLPLVVVLSNLYGFVPGAVVLGGATILSGEGSARLVLLVPATLLGAALVVSLAAALSALQVYFRDIRYLLQAALLAWFYVTPVIYPLEEVGDLAPFIRANPVSGVVLLFREATVGADEGWQLAIAWTIGWTIAFAIAALLLHRRYDRVFVDLL
jgi:lipopolysaccharide transport system permease protein